MVDLTPDEKKFLLQLMEKTPLTGKAADLRALLELIASIQNKLTAPEPPAEPTA